MTTPFATIIINDAKLQKEAYKIRLTNQEGNIQSEEYIKGKKGVIIFNDKNQDQGQDFVVIIFNDKGKIIYTG